MLSKNSFLILKTVVLLKINIIQGALTSFFQSVQPQITTFLSEVSAQIQTEQSLISEEDC